MMKQRRILLGIGLLTVLVAACDTGSSSSVSTDVWDAADGSSDGQVEVGAADVSDTSCDDVGGTWDVADIEGDDVGGTRDVAAVEDADGGGDAGAVSTCVASENVYKRGREPKEAVPVGDLDGDGTGETVSLDESGEERPPRLDIEQGGQIVLADEPGSGWFVLGEELTGDGIDDLVVGDRWFSKVAVFEGPIDDERQWSDADHLFRGEPEGFMGATNLFGTGFAAGDFNDDGTEDLLIPAPGEAETACVGQEPPTVFLGPFDQELYTRNDAEFTLEGPRTVCLGHYVSCRANQVWLYEYVSGPKSEAPCYAYDLPLSASMTPDTCDR